MWGTLPVRQVRLPEHADAVRGGGGLEHKNSTDADGQPLGDAAHDGLPGVAGAGSHEFFHAWNVKRLRPVELGPFDYENEVYTRSLWVAEGVTDYYADLSSSRRSVDPRGISSTRSRTRSRSSRPRRDALVQPVEQASFDAWIKFYRPDENSPNRRSATTRRAPCWGSCSTRRFGQAPAARRAWTT